MKSVVVIVVTLLLLGCNSAKAPADAADTIDSTTTPSAIEVTHWPAEGDTSSVLGKIHGYNPANYKIAAFLYVDGWYNKPDWETPTIPIAADSSFFAHLCTAPDDTSATRIALFLIPINYSTPIVGDTSNAFELPAALYTNAVDSIILDRNALVFSGYKWQVKHYEELVGPGPNYFTGEKSDVFVDSVGNLHLKIVNRNGHWYSSEIISYQSFGFGNYTFTIAPTADSMPLNAVLGMFLWDDISHSTELNVNHEIDFELSRWGDPEYANFQNVLQPEPWTEEDNIHRFEVNTQQTSVHTVHWSTDSVSFTSTNGDSTINHWNYVGTRNPLNTGYTQVHLNLWLTDGTAPSTGKDFEVVLKSFKFSP